MSVYLLLFTYCLCVLNSVKIENFFKFAVDESYIPSGDDNYIEVKLNHKIPYFNDKFDTIYVSTNGTIFCRVVYNVYTK